MKMASRTKVRPTTVSAVVAWWNAGGGTRRVLLQVFRHFRNQREHVSKLSLSLHPCVRSQDPVNIQVCECSERGSICRLATRRCTRHVHDTQQTMIGGELSELCAVALRKKNLYKNINKMSG